MTDPSTSGRLGDWMVTFRGIVFWPLDPRPEEVDVRDIAHHLARTCRWNGAVRKYYSVAEHCVLLAAHFTDGHPRELARWALLHDAAEAYIGDVIRPLKHSLTGYAEIERRLEHVIWARFGLEGDLPAIVKTADTAIIGDERAHLFRDSSIERQIRREGETGLGLRPFEWSPQRATMEFLSSFNDLFPEHRVP